MATLDWSLILCVVGALNPSCMHRPRRQQGLTRSEQEQEQKFTERCQVLAPQEEPPAIHQYAEIVSEGFLEVSYRDLTDRFLEGKHFSQHSPHHPLLPQLLYLTQLTVCSPALPT